MSAQWPQLLYSLFVCFGSGTLVFLGISEVTASAHRSRKAAAVAAALLLLVGAVALVVSRGDIGAIISMMNGVSRGNPKSIAIVGTIVGLFVAIAYAIVAFRADSYADDEETTDTSTAGKVLGIAALLCGIALPIFMGMADAPARVPWTKWAAPLAYLGNALAMGGALYAGIMSLRNSETQEFSRYAMMALVAAAIQTVFFAVFAGNAGFAFDALIFWGGVIVVGCVVPIVCMVMAPKIRMLAFAAVIGSFIGGICIRLIIQAVASGNPGLNLIFAATQHASLIG